MAYSRVKFKCQRYKCHKKIADNDKLQILKKIIGLETVKNHKKAS
jgi:hypothetical protein